MSGIFVLCLGYLSYVWDIGLMSGGWAGLSSLVIKESSSKVV